MNVKPFSLIDDDEDNSSQTHFSSKMKKTNKEEDIYDIKNKKTINSGIPINNNINTEKKENEMKDIGNNNQQKIINDFRDKIKKEKLFQMNIKNKILSQFNNTNNNTIKEIQSIEQQQDINNMIKNEEKKEEKLSKTLLNDKKEKKKSYNGKIYFYIAISMLLYQYLSYIFLIEVPIIQSKYILIYIYNIF